MFLPDIFLFYNAKPHGALNCCPVLIASFVQHCRVKIQYHSTWHAGRVELFSSGHVLQVLNCFQKPAELL